MKFRIEVAGSPNKVIRVTVEYGNLSAIQDMVESNGFSINDVVYVEVIASDPHVVCLNADHTDGKRCRSWRELYMKIHQTVGSVAINHGGVKIGGE